MFIKNLSASLFISAIMMAPVLAQAPASENIERFKTGQNTLSAKPAALQLALMVKPKSKFEIKSEQLESLLADYENDPAPVLNDRLQVQINSFGRQVTRLSAGAQKTIDDFDKLQEKIDWLKNKMIKQGYTLEKHAAMKKSISALGLDLESIMHIRGSMVQVGEGGCLAIDSVKLGTVKVMAQSECNNHTSQQWLQDTRHALHSVAQPGLCLQGQGTSPVELGPCVTGNPDQAWYRHDNGSLQGEGGHCLEVSAGNTANLGYCQGKENQSWSHLTLNLNPLLAMLDHQQLEYLITAEK